MTLGACLRLDCTTQSMANNENLHNTKAGNKKSANKDNTIEFHLNQICADIERRKQDGVLEATDANLLTRLIRQNPDDADQIASLGTMLHRTGLVFQQQSEKRTDAIQYLKRDDSLSFHQGGGSVNRLVIGDNYPALQNLLIQYRGQIDVIYIDPPYGKDSMGEYAKTNYQNAISRDNLLSSLQPRLQLAKELLSDNGIIFCSIDDKNEAYVKCLMDDIFDERNFVASCPRKTVSSKTTKSDHELQKLYDYLLIYVKSDNSHFTKNVVGRKTYPYHDDRGDYYLVPLQDNGPHGTRTARPNLWYPIYQTADGRLVLERESDSDKEFLPGMHKGDQGRWMWSKAKFASDNKDLAISNVGVVSIKHYYRDGEDTNKYQPWKDWLDSYLNGAGSTMLGGIIGSNIFPNPKPIELVKWCINLHPNKNCTVLDFYAGSGTTGQAVLDLNKEDGGNRTFILCTNEDHGENGEFPHGIARDVTYERLYRVMQGKGTHGENFPWAEKNHSYGGNLEVDRIEAVSTRNDLEGQTPLDVIDEALYGMKKFDSVSAKALWIGRNFKNATKMLKKGGD